MQAEVRNKGRAVESAGDELGRYQVEGVEEAERSKTSL